MSRRMLRLYPTGAIQEKNMMKGFLQGFKDEIEGEDRGKVELMPTWLVLAIMAAMAAVGVYAMMT